VEEPDPDGEDEVEALAQVERLEPHDEELGPPVRDEGRVAARRGLDHLRRPVHGGEAASGEALADERGRDPVAAPDLQHPVLRPDAQPVDDRAQALAHGASPPPPQPRAVDANVAPPRQL
jgi:hypothetical protein